MLELFPKAISIYKWGSSTLPFIKTPNDIDYLIVYKNEEDIESLDIPKQTEFDFHFFIISLEDLTSNKYINLFKTSDEKRHHALFQASCSNTNLIMFHWAELVEGQDLNLNQYYNIKDLEVLDSLKVSILKVIDRLFFTTQIEKQILKYWYYLALAFYVYLNNSYELTPVQIDLINKFHDLKATFNDCVWLYNQIDLFFDSSL